MPRTRARVNLYLTERISTEIALMVRRMMYPAPFLNWARGLDGAERTGRIKRAKQSVLCYGLARYLLSQLPVIPGVEEAAAKVEVFPLDTEVEIRVTDPKLDQPESLVVSYPDWLRDFLDEDENFELLVPTDQTTLEDTLDRIFDWCMEHPPYDILVRPAH